MGIHVALQQDTDLSGVSRLFILLLSREVSQMQASRINTKTLGIHIPEDGRPLPGVDSGSSRICLHVLTGRVDVPKVCTRQFECYHCGFDQLLDDMDAAGQPDCCIAVSR